MKTNYAEKQLAIAGLSVRNVMGVTAVDLVFDPERNLFVIGGANEAGKTSTINALWFALGGAKNIPEQPVRDGETTARVELQVNNRVTGTPELTVIRSWWYDKRDNLKTKLELLNAKGNPVPGGAQGILDTLYSHLIDPVEFMAFDHKRQVEAVRECVGLDFRALDDERKELYADRTVANAGTKAAQARLDAATFHPEAHGKTAPDTAELVKAQQEADELRQRKEDAQWKADQQAARASQLQEEAERLTERLKVVINEKATLELDVAGLLDTADGITVPDVGDITEQLHAAETLREQLRENEEYGKLQDATKQAAADAKTLTKRIDAIDAEKEDALAGAKFPIAGMSFDGDHVLLGGIPLDSCATSQQIRVSTAMALTNPPALPVLIIRRSESLDVANLKVIEEMAKEAGAYIIAERVSEGPECSVIIEAGFVQGASHVG